MSGYANVANYFCFTNNSRHSKKQAEAIFYLFASRQYAIFNIIPAIYIALIYYLANLLLLS